MSDMLLSAISLLLNVQNFVAIVAGTALGVALGAIPGLTGIMAIALIIPFTYYIGPVASLLLLMGVSKGAVYGGSITAILINTPGTPASAATSLDGYPLVKQGKALKALWMALYASIMADTFSDLILIFVAGLLASIALKFGPSEYAMLVVFSLTIVSTVSGKHPLKGMISAAAGLFLATVGLDPMEGTPRFDFGMTQLYEGIGLIPMMIGLFAFSEALRQGEEQFRGKIPSAFIPVSDNPDDNRVTKEEMKAALKPIFRASLIGTFLGAVPGIGPPVAAFLSYGETKRTSRHPEKFGHGALEGVAAAEAGNNAVCGANLIPLLTLGVPGDATAAVLLGAFLLQGLAPGPRLFEQNGNIIYAFFLGLIVCNAANFFIGAGAIKMSRRLCNVSKTLVIPVILMLCCIGSFAVNSSLFDVKVMILFGLLGYCMSKFGFAIAPMVIAFILEPIGESSIRQALALSRGGLGIFFTHPISLGFIVLTVLTVSLSVLRVIKGARKRS